MLEAQSRLVALIDAASPREGAQASPVPGVSCIKVSQAQKFQKRTWRASICISAQGTKEIVVDGKMFRARGLHYVVTPMDLPVSSRAANSKTAPLLALKFDFDAHALREVASQLPEVSAKVCETRAIFIGKATERMVGAAIRLCELFATPDDATVLAPLAMREIMFHILKSTDGPALRQHLRAGSNANRIAAAVHHLQTSLREPADIESLARQAGMSRAAFFKHFKEATAMSPLQYQKRLRLLEARRLMLEEGEGAETAAFSVGYTSPSQFSREYSRMFGDAPFRDTRTPASAAATATL
jgi:AraC-like DNA-binding protein